MNIAQRVVIIGGVAAGLKAAARLARLDPAAKITVIEKGRLISYAACGIPYYVEGLVDSIDHLMDTPVGTVRNPAFFRAVNGIEVRTQTQAERIDRTSKTVHVKDLSSGRTESLGYDRLVIATGALPIVPPITGVDLKHVYCLYRPEEADQLRRELEGGRIKRAVLVGGGLIGMEAAEALTARGVQVTVVEMMDYVLPALLDLEPAAFLTKHLRAKGVTVVTGSKVTAIQGDAGGKVSGVVAGERRIDADMVLLAIGIRPNVDLAREAGLQIGPTGAIAVNDRCQTSDPDIYAGGDCVECTHRITGQKVFVPLGSTANKHGRVIGDNLAGIESRFEGILGTCIFKAFDYSVARTGLTERRARQAGYDVRISLAPAPDRAHYYPGSKPIFVKLIADARGGRFLGAQVVGPGECAKRIDVLATAMHFGGTMDDVPALDLAYAPPFAAPVDNVAHAANVLRNKRDGIASTITPQEVYGKLQSAEDFVLLDVRTPAEIDEMRIDDPRVVYIGLGKLRDRLAELPRDKEIITYCKISQRGYDAQRILAGAGFRNVKFMDGGLTAWPYELKTGSRV
jgi:NADPH-dependent 2,4-dienoyl-CoA reductase/sulfur reductase-like enzyme/rhodanese-related sulfurtransferase